MAEETQADAVVPVMVGTALWGLALIAALALRSHLVAAGTDWWIWVAVTGFGLGLVGTWWVRRRRAAHRADPAPHAD